MDPRPPATIARGDPPAPQPETPRAGGPPPRRVRPGVLALQGSVEPHTRALARSGWDPVLVRQPRHLTEVSHLVLPGGESTTLEKLLVQWDLWETIRARGASGDLALFGTCAGAILLGRGSAEAPRRMELLDAEVRRNAYGRQIDSFVSPLESEVLGPFEGVFIRAPRFGALGPGTTILARRREEPVLIVERRLLAATFHPELTDSTGVHEYFLGL